MYFPNYKNKLEYPKMPSRPLLSRKPTVKEAEEFVEKLRVYTQQEIEYKAKKEKYVKEEGRLHNLFKADCLKEVGLENHPKKDKIFSYAWQKGHSSGYSEVFYYLSEVSEIV